MSTSEIHWKRAKGVTRGLVSLVLVSLMAALFHSRHYSRASLGRGTIRRKAFADEKPETTKTTTTRVSKSVFPVSNLRLVMMGDSLTRYQYLSLINFLHRGSWRTTYLQQGISWRDITTEHSFRNWTNFYGFTNSIFDGKEICDCFRGKPNYIRTVRENRYYADVEAYNFVTYIQRFGNFATRGMVLPAQVYKGTNPWFNKNTTDFAWKYSTWESMIREYLSKMDPKPQYFVFNAGWWTHDLNPKTLANIRNALVENGIVGIYKTTTRARNQTDDSLDTYEQVACQMFPCLNLQWTAHLPESAYTDNLHFRSEPYRQMNRQLLGLLEGLGPHDAPGGSVRIASIV